MRSILLVVRKMFGWSKQEKRKFQLVDIIDRHVIVIVTVLVFCIVMWAYYPLLKKKSGWSVED